MLNFYTCGQICLGSLWKRHRLCVHYWCRSSNSAFWVKSNGTQFPVRLHTCRGQSAECISLRWSWIVNRTHMEGNGRGLFQGTIPAFAWRDWGIPSFVDRRCTTESLRSHLGPHRTCGTQFHFTACNAAGKQDGRVKISYTLCEPDPTLIVAISPPTSENRTTAMLVSLMVGSEIYKYEVTSTGMIFVFVASLVTWLSSLRVLCTPSASRIWRPAWGEGGRTEHTEDTSRGNVWRSARWEDAVLSNAIPSASSVCLSES